MATCPHFDGDEGFPIGIPATSKEQGLFVIVNDAICSHSKDGPGTIMKIISIQREMKIGYKQLFLFAGISAGIHRGDGKGPCGPFLGYAKTKQALMPVTPVPDGTGTKPAFAGRTLKDKPQEIPGIQPGGESVSLMDLVKGHLGGFQKPLYPVFKDGDWALEPVPPLYEDGEGVLL